MKKIIIAAVLLPMIVCAADVVDTFEKLNWKSWNKPQFKFSYKRIADEGRTAKGALEIAAKPGNPAKNDGNFLREFAVKPNSDYRAVVYVKAKDINPEAYISVAAQSMGKKMEFQARLGSVKFVPGTDWQKIEFQFQTIHVTANVRFFMAAVNLTKGSVIFDDFKFGHISSFTDCSDNFNTLAWGNWNLKDAKIKYSLNTEEGRKKPGAAMMTFLKGHPANRGGSFTRRLAVKPGKEYTFVVFVKNLSLAPQARISFGVQPLNAKRQFLGLPQRTTAVTAAECGDWKRLVLTVKIPNTGKWAQTAMMLVTMSASRSSEGSVIFDDFEFFEEENEEEI